VLLVLLAAYGGATPPPLHPMGALFSRGTHPRFAKGVWYDSEGRVERTVYDDLREGAHARRPIDRRVPLADAPHPGYDGFFEDDLVMVFVPDKPCAAEHLLVVPKDNSLRTCRSVAPEHLPLLRHMQSVGEQQLLARSRRADSPARADGRLEFSYHVPPFNSINHLHLHAFALPFDSVPRRIKYLPGTPWCMAHERLVDKLRAERGPRDSARDKLR
jgi:diadenosine tetraphosphate (Ap4A) HIT family hydrolase